MKKRIGMLVIAGLCGLGTEVVQAINPSADAWVATATDGTGTEQDTNYGGNIELRVGDSYHPRHNRSLMKFDLSGIADGTTITNAKLFVYCVSGNGEIDLGLYEVADDTWTEMGVTWNNQPSSGGLIANYGAVPSATWLEIDVTASVSNTFVNPSDDLWSIALKGAEAGANRSVSLRSKEASRLEPYLEINSQSDLGDIEITPAQDTRVISTHPTLNKGTDVELRVGDQDVEQRHNRSFLQFDISGIDSEVSITSAKLYLSNSFAYSSNDVRVCSVADDSWDENVVTWDAQPSHGAVVGTFGTVGGFQNDFVFADVTAALQAEHAGGDGNWSIMLKDAAEKDYTGAGPFEDGNTSAAFWSSDKDATLTPYLKISWVPSFDVATIVAWSATNDMMRMVIDVPGLASGYYPMANSDLVIGAWESVAHSDDGVNDFIVTNLSYSTADETNKVIYVHTTDAEGFFCIKQ